MKEFVALRAKAREKRDLAIARARTEYEETLTRIAALEQDLLGKEVSSHRQISECVERVIPTDREFTTVDVMTALEALDPGRVWRKRSVDSHISRMRERGLIRRLRKARTGAHANEPAVYVRAGVPVAERPFQGQTLRDVLKATLADGPMTQLELTVTLLERGYDTTMTPRAFRAAVGGQLRNNPADFVKVDGKWATYC